jgi:hypothetical protein
MLQRSALTITRKQPYADWANGAGEDESDTVPYTEELPRTVYLVPPIDSTAGIGELLDEFWSDIFVEELAAWSEDEGSRPTPLTRQLFDEWFDAELTDAVVDLTPDEPRLAVREGLALTLVADDEQTLAGIVKTLVERSWRHSAPPHVVAAFDQRKRGEA